MGLNELARAGKRQIEREGHGFGENPTHLNGRGSGGVRRCGRHRKGGGHGFGLSRLHTLLARQQQQRVVQLA